MSSIAKPEISNRVFASAAWVAVAVVAGFAVVVTGGCVPAASDSGGAVTDCAGADRATTTSRSTSHSLATPGRRLSAKE